jgi:hypothetical protein
LETKGSSRDEEIGKPQRPLMGSSRDEEIGKPKRPLMARGATFVEFMKGGKKVGV